MATTATRTAPGRRRRAPTPRVGLDELNQPAPLLERLLSASWLPTLLYAWFAVQATVIAVATRYGIPPDERTHVRSIQLYVREGLSPFLSTQEGFYDVGPLLRSPSYLYYWLLSFVARVVPGDGDAELVLLRLVNVALGVGTLIVARKLLEELGLPRWLQLLTLFLLVNTLMWVFLAGSVNYDNLVNLLSVACLLVTLRLLRELTWQRLVALFGLGSRGDAREVHLRAARGVDRAGRGGAAAAPRTAGGAGAVAADPGAAPPTRTDGGRGGRTPAPGGAVRGALGRQHDRLRVATAAVRAGAHRRPVPAVRDLRARPAVGGPGVRATAAAALVRWAVVRRDARPHVLGHGAPQHRGAGADPGHITAAADRRCRGRDPRVPPPGARSERTALRRRRVRDGPAAGQLHGLAGDRPVRPRAAGPLRLPGAAGAVRASGSPISRGCCPGGS